MMLVPPVQPVAAGVVICPKSEPAAYVPAVMLPPSATLQVNVANPVLNVVVPLAVIAPPGPIVAVAAAALPVDAARPIATIADTSRS